MRYFSDFLETILGCWNTSSKCKSDYSMGSDRYFSTEAKNPYVTSPVSQAAMQAVKPWSIRTAFNTAVCILGFLDICLSLRESVWMSRCLYICPSEWLSSVLGCWSVNSDVCLCVWISGYLSVCLCVLHLSVCIWMYICLGICMSECLF